MSMSASAVALIDYAFPTIARLGNTAYPYNVDIASHAQALASEKTMTDLQTAELEMIYCPKCRTANPAASFNCRKCDSDLSKAGKLQIPMWAAVAALGLILLFILMVLANVLFDSTIYVIVSLIFIGVLMAVVGILWFLTVAFRQGVVWGLACVFLPVASFVFALKYMDRAGRPIGLSALGVAIIVVGGFLTTVI